MLAIVRSAREWWMGLAVALALASVALGGLELSEFSDLRALSHADARPAAGKLELTSKRLRLLGASGVTLDCPVNWCGYPGMSADVGKHVVAHSADGRIVQVQVDGERRDTLELIMNHKKNRILWFAIQLLVGCAIGFLAYKSRAKAD